MAFTDSELLQLIGTNGIQITVGVLSFIWLFQVYLRYPGRYRNFWLLLCIGMLCSISGTSIWLYLQLSQQVLASTASSSFFWVLSYFFFLAALIYKSKEIGISLSNKTYLFNISVYMVSAIGVSYQYLLKPILITEDTSSLMKLYTIGYQLADLGMLFFGIILYYLIRFESEKRFLLFLIAGLLLQIFSDAVIPYVSITGNHYSEYVSSLIGIIVLLLIGFTALYKKGIKPIESVKPEMLFDKKEFFFPYICIFLLTALVIYSKQWHLNLTVLDVSLLIIFLLVIMRQINVMSKNTKLMEELKDLAYNDLLTGLFNRSSLKQNIETMMKSTDGKFALLLIDLDRFKMVNDTLGHHIGDQILIETGNRFRKAANPEDQIYRLGGDEFVFILPDAGEANALTTAKLIVESFQSPFMALANEINLTPSIGVALFPGHGETSDDLLKNADAAMYLSKENGKNGFTLYNTEINSYMKRKMEIESHLKRAIENNQLSLVYQPKVDLRTKHIGGAEALLRWNHPALGPISPAEFIPIAEETGQIIAIGNWVLETACKQNKAWQNQGLPPLNVSVNVSVPQLQNGQFPMTVKNVLKETQLDACFLELEITESIMQNVKESVPILMQLKELGVKISIDDFGTGYSSLHVLSKLPIDTIKIDKSFIDVLNQTDESPIIKAIIELGLNLNLSIVAEGIETEKQMEYLQKNGPIVGQGYLFSKPLQASEFAELIREN